MTDKPPPPTVVPFVKGRDRLLPAAVVMPAMSAALGYRLDLIELLGTRAALDDVLPSPVPALGDEARKLLPALVELCRPAPPHLIRVWLLAVAVGVRNPPNDAALPQQVQGIIRVSGDLPALCWTEETLVGFMRRGKEAAFWPAHAEVDIHLRARGDIVKRRLAAMQAIADRARRPAPEPAKPAVQAERDAVVAAFRANMASAFARPLAALPEEPPAPPRPSHLPPDQLRAVRNASRARHGLPPLPLPPTEGAPS